jgi:drug/metabolite transporter (DMT)-like permease
VKNKWVPALVILLLGCIWGSSFIIIKRGLLSFAPIQVAAWRLAFAGWVLFPVVLLTFRKLRKNDMVNLFLSGLLGNAIPAFLFSMAGTMIPSGLSGILNAMTPMFTLIIGALFFQSSYTRNGLLGVVAGIIGAGFLLAPQFLQGATPGMNPLGALMPLCGAILYGYNINLIKHKLSHLSPTVVSAYPMWFMALPYTLVLIATDAGNAWQVDSELAWRSLGYLAILGVIGSALSMVIFNSLVKYTTALVASTNTFVIPVVAVMWGLMDNEKLTWNMFVGLALAFVGIYLVMWRKEKEPKEAVISEIIDDKAPEQLGTDVNQIRG